MASAPIFETTPRLAVAQVSAANTNRDGTGTIVDIITGVAAGTQIEMLRVVSIGTVTAGAVRLYLYDGTNTRMFKEIIVPATTPSTTIEAWSYTLLLVGANRIILPSASWKVQASTHNAEVFNIFAAGADLT